MRRKLKSFFEDFLTIAVIIGVIYASYTYFFDDEDSNFHNSNSQVVVQDAFKSEIKEPNQEDAILDKVFDKNEDEEYETANILATENSTNETTNQELMTENIPTQEIREIQEVVENSTETNSSSKFRLIETSKIEKSSSSEEEYKKEKFYSDLKSNILNNLNSLNIEDIEKNSFVNFRVTILKDGRYEQIFFDGGNNKLFNLSKTAVAKVFPLEIEPELKYLFPRYYRFKIEFN